MAKRRDAACEHRTELLGRGDIEQGVQIFPTTMINQDAREDTAELEANVMWRPSHQIPGRSSRTMDVELGEREGSQILKLEVFVLSIFLRQAEACLKPAIAHPQT
ncbi:hypothetical protein D3C86_1437980 [compost metagenome]